MRGFVLGIKSIARMEHVDTSMGIGDVQVNGANAAASVVNVAQVKTSAAMASASLATARRPLAHRKMMKL